MSSDGHNGEILAAWASAVHAMTLFQESLTDAKQFYGEALGLPQVHEDDDSVVFKVGETLVNLLSIEAADELVEPTPVGSAGSGARSVYTVQVDDVDALCAELIARGVTLLNGPTDRWWGPRTASFADPAGHIWEIASR